MRLSGGSLATIDGILVMLDVCLGQLRIAIGVVVIDYETIGGE